MSGDLVYNEDAMRSIAAEYRNAASSMDDAMSQCKSAMSVVQSDYDGQGTPLATDLFNKLHEHMDLLKSCYEVLANFTESSLEEFLQLDSELGGKINPTPLPAPSPSPGPSPVPTTSPTPR